MPINALVVGLEARNKIVFGCKCSSPWPFAEPVVAEPAEASKRRSNYQYELLDRIAAITAEYAVSMDIAPQTCFAAIP